MSMFLAILAKIAFLIIIIIANSFPLQAKLYNLNFQSSDPAGNPNFIIQQQWANKVKIMSGGRIVIEILPVGSVVEYNETHDAIASGILDGHITDTSYFAGKDPSFGLIANPIGAWSKPQELFQFIEFGGGKKLINQLLEPYGIHVIGVITSGIESFVSTIPLDNLNDLKGLKVRAPEGMVNEVFAAAGATPVNIPSSEIFTSLDKKVIEAADYSVFSTNQAQGLHSIAKHSIYPGFHSLPLNEVSINKVIWRSLPPDLQSILIVSVRDLAQYEVNQLSRNDHKAILEATIKGTVTIHNWSERERKKFRQLAVKQWKNVAQKSENAQKVYDILIQYLTAQNLL